jgi:hypothetical protein
MSCDYIGDQSALACVIRWTCTFGEKCLSSRTSYMTDGGIFLFYKFLLYKFLKNTLIFKVKSWWMYSILCLYQGIVFLDFHFLAFPILFSVHVHINLVYISPHTIRLFRANHIVMSFVYSNNSWIFCHIVQYVVLNLKFWRFEVLCRHVKVDVTHGYL